MSIVLISEDEKETMYFQSFLHEMEMPNVWHYATVEQAQHGLSEVQQMTVDVVLINKDCTYESRDSVYGDIASLQQWIQAPIILITSYETRETIGGAFFAGIYDFMLKPVDFSYFKARLHIAIRFHSEMRRRKVQDYNLEKDLLIAKNVQKSALSSSFRMTGLDIDGFNRMSHTLGGDMYYWSQVSKQQVSIILYDVMGHGVASALVSMSIRSLLREIMAHASDPVQVMQELNGHIYALFAGEELEGYLVTAIYLLVDKERGTIEYVNAGHPTGYLYNKRTNHALLANTPILGLLPDILVQKQKIALPKQARLILYTDGLQQEQGIVDEASFQEYLAYDNETDLQRFIEDGYLASKPVKDDISVVFITILS